MIAYYFDEDARQLVQSVQSRVQLDPQTWVYGDNYNLQIYITRSGVIQVLNVGDSLSIMAFQPPATLPATNLITVGSPQVLTDANGNQFYQVNVNLQTTQLAALTQTPNTSAQVKLHLIFTPADAERFSMSADIQITVNPDPSESAAGATPVPPGYPTNSNVFELVAHKGIAGGYAALDGNAKLDPNKIPTDSSLHVVSSLLSVVGGGGGSGNPYVTTVSNGFTIPAEGAATGVLAISADSADLLVNEGVLITDGVRFINGTLTAVVHGASPTITVNNNGGGSVSGSMNAGAHVYLGNSAPLFSSSGPGLTPSTSGAPAGGILGLNGWALVAWASISNPPATFPPSPHGSTHISGDPISLGTPTTAGLMPPIDNSSITIVGGKLQSNVVAGGGAVAVANITGSPAVPALGASVTYTLAAAWSGFHAGQSVVITDGVQVVNGIITTYSGTSLTVRNLGTPGTSVSGNFGVTCYVFMGGSPDLATTAAPGIVTPDNVTLGISGGKLVSNIQPYVAVITGTPSIPAAGATATYTLSNITVTDFSIGQSVLITDGSKLINGIVTAWSGSNLTIRNLGNTGSAVTGSFAGTAHVYQGNCSDLASTSAPGIVQPDGTSITIASGKISAAGGIGAHGCMLYNNLGGQAIPSLTKTSLQFDTVNWDTDAYHGAGAAPWTTLTVPASQYGVYLITANVFWNSATSTVIRLAIVLGASFELAVVESDSTTVASFLPAQAVSAIAYLGNTAPPGHTGSGAALALQTTVAAQVYVSGAQTLPGFSTLSIQRIA